ncbi:unnamed protein product, partial [Sphagnum compactum]
MPRSANRIVGHLMSTPTSPPSSSTSPINGMYPKSSIFLYRPPSIRTTGTSGTGGGGSVAGSSIRQQPLSVTLRRGSSHGSSIRRPTQNNLSPTADGNKKPQMLACPEVDDYDSIEAIDADNVEYLPSSTSHRKVSIVEGNDGEVEIILEEDEPVIFTIFEAANIDGVQHLSSKSRCTRYTWFLLITIFVCMCFYQITTQALMFWWTPIATNIAALYPSSVPFPVVAICNNNQYRLTYLTGPMVQNRRARNGSSSNLLYNENSTSIFDQALVNTWDMDAVKFLRNAAHWKARMVQQCQWPNGTRCKTTDFKPIWTLTGLCWAINTDPINPHHVTGAGPGNALRLLLNIERYERIESCNPKFRTNSLPGLKILIYNQSDFPASSLEGVNVLPGFTIDIPFRMQHRQKLSGRDCVEDVRNEDGSFLDFDSPSNVRTCLVRSYLSEIENRCNCSMKHAYNPYLGDKLPFCNVQEYFSCVTEVLKWGYDGGFSSNFKCLAPCEEIDYTAWQDMNELAGNIFPKLIDANPDGDQEEPNEGEIENENDELEEQEHFKCEDNQLLEDVQVNRIKREAHRAYEKQARYQEDILLRTKRLINRIRMTSN